MSDLQGTMFGLCRAEQLDAMRLKSQGFSRSEIATTLARTYMHDVSFQQVKDFLDNAKDILARTSGSLDKDKVCDRIFDTSQQLSRLNTVLWEQIEELEAQPSGPRKNYFGIQKLASEIREELEFQHRLLGDLRPASVDLTVQIVNAMQTGGKAEFAKQFIRASQTQPVTQ